MRFRSPQVRARKIQRSGVLIGAVLIGVVLLSPANPAGASTTTVGVANYAFTPSSVQVALGGTVSWQFHADHTTTSNQGFWNSGERTSGSFDVAFPDAGSFGYHCMMHPSMTGVVRVPMKSTGQPLTGYRLTWSARSTTPGSIRYDVQYKRSGATRWTSFRAATAQRSARFNPVRSGSYLLRARTRRAGHGASGWAATLHLMIS